MKSAQETQIHRREVTCYQEQAHRKLLVKVLIIMVEFDLGEYTKEQKITQAELSWWSSIKRKKTIRSLQKPASRNNHLARKALLREILILLLKELCHFSEQLGILPPHEKTCLCSEHAWCFSIVRYLSHSRPAWIP